PTSLAPLPLPDALPTSPREEEPAPPPLRLASAPASLRRPDPEPREEHEPAEQVTEPATDLPEQPEQPGQREEPEPGTAAAGLPRSEEHTSELQSRENLV